MTRRTSIEAYEAICAEGLLPPRRLELYRILYAHGPMTATETLARYRGPWAVSGGNARFTELREQGCIYEVRERPCTINPAPSQCGRA